MRRATPAARPERRKARPISVALLALPGVVPFDLVIAGHVFGGAARDEGTPRYDVTLCSLQPGMLSMAGGVPIGIAHGLDVLAHAATIVVPGLGDVEAPVPAPAIAALRAAKRRGARIVSICTGAFVLAEAGLLDGRPATTHWAHLHRFAERYPQVRLDPRVLYVDDGDVLTSAGMAAGIDLCLHIVRSDWGAEVANVVARRMVVAPHRDGGQAQYIVQPVPPPGSDGLEPTRLWALQQLHRPLTIPALAARSHMSVRHFVRRFREEMGVPPLRWLHAQRLILAQRLLETTELPMSRVAERSGLGSAATLRAHFQRALGVAPVAYRRTFRGRSSP